MYKKFGESTRSLLIWPDKVNMNLRKAVMPHSIGVGATLVALNREAEASPTQFFPALVRHYEKHLFKKYFIVKGLALFYNTHESTREAL